MDRVLNDFIVSLRGAGVPVSVSESIDAAQALAISGYGDRRVVKSSLGATLAKSVAEKENPEGTAIAAPALPHRPATYPPTRPGAPPFLAPAGDPVQNGWVLRKETRP